MCEKKKQDNRHNHNGSHKEIYIQYAKVYQRNNKVYQQGH